MKIRKGKYEGQTAIIEIPRKQAGNLIKLRKLRIGWTECGIRERIKPCMSLKVLQTNLGRGRAAHDLAYATAKNKGVDIILVSEPNKTITKGD
ncbi:hypothetical protein QE152_g26700 [Popillia japonica]|uniref:Ribosomal protein L16 n=1 Tax=Popillia japonica TaxID=7064 RepID=A0AAW1JY20_POPJA